eukprot:3383563-Amphidinium_carterae.1
MWLQSFSEWVGATKGPAVPTYEEHTFTHKVQHEALSWKCFVVRKAGIWLDELLVHSRTQPVKESVQCRTFLLYRKLCRLPWDSLGVAGPIADHALAYQSLLDWKCDVLEPLAR